MPENTIPDYKKLSKVQTSPTEIVSTKLIDTFTNDRLGVVVTERIDKEYIPNLDLTHTSKEPYPISRPKRITIRAKKI